MKYLDDTTPASCFLGLKRKRRSLRKQTGGLLCYHPRRRGILDQRDHCTYSPKIRLQGMTKHARKALLNKREIAELAEKQPKRLDTHSYFAVQ